MPRCHLSPRKYLYGLCAFTYQYFRRITIDKYKILLVVSVALNILFIMKSDKNYKNDVIGRQYYPPSRDLDLPQILKHPHSEENIEEKDLHKIYSQAKQDSLVYDLFPIENGLFIEMGAFDGQMWSNTLWLERRHNWTGLLIEANPDLCMKIDNLHRKVWRLCACISSEQYATFVQSAALGGIGESMSTHQLKQIITDNQVSVPCFKLDRILDVIDMHHVTYFSLDVEGAEIAVLETMKEELKSGKIIVDIWTIEYRVWDGTKVVFDDSLRNLIKIRNFFREIGGYVEHSQLSNEELPKYVDGWALDVVFVNKKT